MDGFGTFVNALTLVKDAVHMYRHITASREFERIAGTFSAMILFEYFRFETWAEQSGYLAVLDANDGQIGDWTSAAEPIDEWHLRMSTKAHDVVAQMLIVLRELNDLLDKYGIRGKSKSPTVDLDPLEQRITESGPQATQESVFPGIESKSQISLALKDVLRRRARLGRDIGRMKKIRFGWNIANETSDKDQISELIQQLKYWNDGLRDILPIKDQTFNRVVTQMKIVGLSKNPQDLQGIEEICEKQSLVPNNDLYKDIRIGAKMKRERLTLDEGGSCLPATDVDPSRKSAANEIVASHDSFEAPVATVAIGGQSIQVVTETVDYRGKIKDDEATILEDRVKQLVWLLRAKERPSSLIIPTSLGYTRSGPLKFTLMYEMPDFAQASSSPGCRTLYSLFPRNPHSVLPTIQIPMFPALGDRYELARALTVGLLRLHSIEWLHKNFSSENVLLFNHQGDIDISRPMMIGFGLGRPSDLTSKTIDLRAMKPSFGIYQHPELRTTSHRRYRQRYDIYSLGMMLFEIGTWQNLHRFKEKDIDPEEFRRFIRNYCQNFLPHVMGRRYCQIILCCIDNDEVWIRAEDSLDGPLRVKEEFTWRVVQELSKGLV